MYALLVPSAQRFISAVLAKVNVELRAIGVATGAPTPCLFSPAWIARVASPQRWTGFFVIGAPLSRSQRQMPQPNWSGRNENLPRAVPTFFGQISRSA